MCTHYAGELVLNDNDGNDNDDDIDEGDGDGSNNINAHKEPAAILKGSRSLPNEGGRKSQNETVGRASRLYSERKSS